ncbi:MAG: 50S ribosomal protein L21 [Planctomycetota bacterium]
MYAVLSDRGRQATVRVGDVLACDRRDPWKPGDAVVFAEVLLVSQEGEVRVGSPTIPGARVTGEVIGPARGPKVVAFRLKRRKNVRVKRGHRQGMTRVRITGIEG